MKNKYHSYKSSRINWVGVIPEHWSVQKIKYIFNEKRSIYNSELSSGSISFGEVVFKDDESISESTKLSYQEVLEGEFLINPLNLNYDLKSLRISLSKIDVVVSQGYIVLQLVSNNNPQYLNYLLREFDIKHLKSLGNGVRQTISFKHLSSEELIIPPVIEQIQIVQYLNWKTELIDKLVSTKEKKITLLKEQRKSIINQIVTKGLNPNVKMKDSGVEWIGEIPEHWVTKKMKFLVQICNGSDFKDFTLEEGGYPVYGSGGEFSRSSKFIYDKVSVLLGRKGSVDKPKIVFEPFWCSDTTYFTKISDDVVPYFFFYLVQQIDFQKYVYGSTIPSMTKSVYDEMIFPFTEILEQYKIVEYLESKTKEIDEIVQLEQKKIDLLKEYRQSLISEVVTGKIKVTTNE